MCLHVLLFFSFGEVRFEVCVCVLFCVCMFLVFSFFRPFFGCVSVSLRSVCVFTCFLLFLSYLVGEVRFEVFFFFSFFAALSLCRLRCCVVAFGVCVCMMFCYFLFGEVRFDVFVFFVCFVFPFFAAVSLFVCVFVSLPSVCAFAWFVCSFYVWGGSV